MTRNENILLGLSRRPSFNLTVLGAPIRLRTKLTNGTFTEGCADSWASLMVQMVKDTPAMWETWVRSLGQESPQEEGIATHSSILSWRIPWTEEPCGPQSMGSQRVGHNWATKYSTQHSADSCRHVGASGGLGACTVGWTEFPSWGRN